ncbi:Na+/H+ antiporter subunit E [Aldersonia sp. NBC_00410]|uniref:Na+/H+ antiporter subunit E n=1 Tax=Aldersonia sp. NBC_00410 TaxID=2975954 RepID=UPI00224FD708|nr:Na+/H+ antiporter subunit E [Aldersonia sp. NBC_00410]MCX5041923.1 Na+/H+ antiporter subunit E [Aldersonia sp. NBC_00410]
MTRSRLVQLGVLLWLTLVWCWLWGHVSVGNILAGLVVGLMIMVLLPLPRVPISGRIHPLSFLKLVGLVIYLSLESSFQVAWLAVRPAPPPVTGVLRIRLAIQSDLVLVLCCDVLNVIPGTMVIELDRARRVAYVHVLNVGSDKAVDAFYTSTRRIEQAFIDAFERPSEWQGPTEIETSEEAGTS